MDKSILGKLRDAREDHKPAIASVFNDGRVTRDDNLTAREAKNISMWENEFTLNVMKDAASSYSRDTDFDSISMDMIMGLVYDTNDVDENDNIKEGAVPLKNIVRYYTMYITSYLDGEKSNTYEYYRGGYNRQGFLRYNDFVKYVKRQGLTFDGPLTFEEFKNRILANEVFDITINAELEHKDNNKLVRKLK